MKAMRSNNPAPVKKVKTGKGSSKKAVKKNGGRK